MEKGIFPLQTELHDSLMPPLPAARRHHSQWHHGAGPGHTLLPDSITEDIPCIWLHGNPPKPGPCCHASLSETIHPCRHLLPMSSPLPCRALTAPCSRAPGAAAAAVCSLSPEATSGQLHLGQVRQIAGLALCVVALLLWVQEVAQGVLLRGMGRLENALRRSPRHQLGTLHLLGDTNLSSQTCPSTQLSLSAAGLMLRLMPCSVCTKS